VDSLASPPACSKARLAAPASQIGLPKVAMKKLACMDDEAGEKNKLSTLLISIYAWQDEASTSKESKHIINICIIFHLR
jgi:hypothetical protein